MDKVNKNDLKIASTLFEFVNNEIIPGTDVNHDQFWEKFSKTVHELAPINKSLLEKREIIQILLHPNLHPHPHHLILFLQDHSIFLLKVLLVGMRLKHRLSVIMQQELMTSVFNQSNQ